MALEAIGRERRRFDRAPARKLMVEISPRAFLKRWQTVGAVDFTRSGIGVELEEETLEVGQVLLVRLSLVTERQRYDAGKLVGRVCNHHYRNHRHRFGIAFDLEANGHSRSLQTRTVLGHIEGFLSRR